MNHASKRPGKGLRVFLIILSGLLVFALAGLGTVYFKLQGNIERDDVEPLLGSERPTRPPEDPSDPFSGKDLNILVMGTDIRDGDNLDIGGPADGARSDSTFLVHASGDRSRVEVISIPRDLLVDIPECERSDGSFTKPQKSAMFNSAFSIGAGADDDIAAAAACTRRTFEQLSGIVTDEHLVIKMDGVQSVIDTLGGVPICLPEAMVSPKANLDLPAGAQILDGQDSIAYLRARTGEGNGLEAGSDLGRIERQQVFLGALSTTVKDKNILSDPPALLKILDQSTKSLNASPGLSGIKSLAGFAFSLKSLDPDAIITSTVPTRQSPKDPNRLVLDKGSDELWERIIEDEPPLSEAPAEPTDEAPQGSSEGALNTQATTITIAHSEPAESPGASVAAQLASAPGCN